MTITKARPKQALTWDNRATREYRGPRRVLRTPPGHGRSAEEIDMTKRTPGKPAGTRCTACGRSKADEPEQFRIRRRRGRDTMYHLCRPCEVQQRHAGIARRKAAAPDCSVDGCVRPVWSRGWCTAHYERWREKGTVGTAEIRRRGDGTEICDFPECGRPHLSRGLCAGHYTQQADGRPLQPIRVLPDATARDGLGRKCCTACQQWLGLDAFHRRSSSPDELSPRCKRCAKCSELTRRFGITLDRYEEMLAAQGHGCAICGKTEKANGRMLAVDHDHACCAGDQACGSCVRGLLCSPCNLHLGAVGDNITHIESMAAYLRATQIGRR